jgi:hypothetical protein
MDAANDLPFQAHDWLDGFSCYSFPELEFDSALFWTSLEGAAQGEATEHTSVRGC